MKKFIDFPENMLKHLFANKQELYEDKPAYHDEAEMEMESLIPVQNTTIQLTLQSLEYSLEILAASAKNLVG